jgi:thioredoxin-like negative regulator of GroEL
MNRLEQIEAMLQEMPDDAELRYMLAMEHASGGNDVEAVRCFQELTTRCPDYPPGFHQGARTLVRLNRITEARAVLQRGIPAAMAKNDLHTAGEMQELLASLE